MIQLPNRPSRSKPPKKQGLRAAQVRALKCLADIGGWLTRDKISEMANIDPAWVGDAVGSAIPERRVEVEKRCGYPSLITLGLLRVKTFDIEGKAEHSYSITEAGRAALTKLQEAGDAPDPDGGQ